MEEAVPVPPPVVAEAVAAEESTSAATSSSSSLPSGEGGEESGGEAPTNKKGRRRLRSAILSLASDEGLSRISFGMSQRSSKSTPTFSCSLDARCERSKKKAARGASPPSRSCNSFCCFLLKTIGEMTQQKHLANLTYRLHKQREMMAPSIELRRRFLASAYHAQLRNEKEMIASHIGRLQPGVRRVFMQRRLDHLNV